ncbi:MAG: hypothetical protein PHC84_06620, partial [Clostridia bacterium]|nr:hypothetical protein [Clostridia bacterium]
MKKNLFIKIVMALLVVLLAFAVVACKKPVPEKKPPLVVPPVANAATLTQIFDFVEKFAPVA